MNELRVVDRAVPKKDAFAIMGGSPVYTGDMVPDGALAVKLLRSPYAFAHIDAIDTSLALKVPGVECVLTHLDMPRHRHSIAGASYPGNNPFDRRILDEWVRFVGDPVAIVAARTAEACEKALKLIKVKYTVLKPVLDYEKACEGETVHPEDNYEFQMDIGGDIAHNILSDGTDEDGDFDGVYAACPYKVDETYYTVQNQQAMMETFRTASYIDRYGRLTLISSTQVTFHARRLVSYALGIPQSRVRVIKPRVGGGFGAKQTLGSEIYAACVTHFTGKSAYLCFTRQETCAYTNTRHRMRIRVRAGADKDGTVKALWVDTLEDAGAYGEHSVNVIGLSGHKTIPLYAKAEAWRFSHRVVYTNTTPGGAYRGFGATQGCYAVECAMNKLAGMIGVDPTEMRLKNLPEAGSTMSAYYGETLNSISLDRCIMTGKRMIGWDEKYSAEPFSQKVGPHRYRGLGMAITMQGSGLTNLDSCTVTLRLEDTGKYGLSIGASDIGTGCDTILAQMAAEVLECDVEDITTDGVDTATSPYDKGSYASSTTYVTGNATVRAAEQLKKKMLEAAGKRLGCGADEVDFDGKTFAAPGGSVSLYELGRDSVNGQNEWLASTVSFSGKCSPPPFVAGFAEVEVDTETGEVELKDIVGVVDCGRVINRSLARVQTEGGFAQGIGMALYEQVHYSQSGRLMTDSFMQYKIPSRMDVPRIRVEFEESDEPTGPFGAKSIGEVVINTPAPAIVSAIRNAVGVEIHDLPATSQKVFEGLLKDGNAGK